jgi:hypothetical protein
MEARSTWRDQHATISKNLIEIDGLAKLHNLTDLQDRIADNRSKTVALSCRMKLIILKIEATPTKMPSYSGDASEDLTNLEDKSQNPRSTLQPRDERSAHKHHDYSMAKRRNEVCSPRSWARTPHPGPGVRRWQIDATSKKPNIHAPEHGHTPAHQANDIITDSGLKGSVMLGLKSSPP